MIMKSKNQGGITMKNNKGLTLLELIIAIAIVFILVAIAVPAYLGQQKRAARTEAFTNLEALRLLEEQFFSENARYTINLGAAGDTVAVRDANVNDIQDTPNAHPPDALRGFRPGTGSNFSVRTIQNQGLTTPVAAPWGGAQAAQNPCFIAVATGITGTRVAGDVFAIDCNNNKNF